MMNSYEAFVLFIASLSFPQWLLKFDGATINLFTYHVNRQIENISFFLISSAALLQNQNKYTGDFRINHHIF